MEAFCTRRMWHSALGGFTLDKAHDHKRLQALWSGVIPDQRISSDIVRLAL